MFSSHRGPGGAGETERLSGWSLCIRVLPQHPGEIQHRHHVGGTPHSKEVSLQSELRLLWGRARLQAGSGRLLPQAAGGKEICFVENVFLSFFSSFFKEQPTDIWPVLKNSTVVSVALL